MKVLRWFKENWCYIACILAMLGMVYSFTTSEDEGETASSPPASTSSADSSYQEAMGALKERQDELAAQVAEVEEQYKDVIQQQKDEEAAEADYDEDATESCSAGETDETETASSGEDEITVYITDTGERYHRDGCSSLRRSKHAITLSEAVAEGYTPCHNCNPPTE